MEDMKNYEASFWTDEYNNFTVVANSELEVFELVRHIFYNTTIFDCNDGDKPIIIAIQEIGREKGFNAYTSNCENYLNLNNKFDDFDFNELFSSASKKQKEHFLNIITEEINRRKILSYPEY